MKASRVEALVWVLVYGGLFLLGLGIALRRLNGDSGDGLGGVLMAVGGVLLAIGAVLVWVRSRMKA